MAEPPGPVARLDHYLATFRIAHETTADLHDELATQGLANDRTRALFRRAAAIAAHEVPQLLSEARRLADRWDEQELLDPLAAGETLRALDEELARVSGEVNALAEERNRIARTLRELLDEALG